jgi:protocatechuate 3,4-dioxygenase alpha subunit
VTLPLTPSQTTGPFLAIGLPWVDGPYVVPEGTPGTITIGGRVLDGAGEPVSPVAGFRGFGRCPTDAAGRYRLLTLRPGRLPSADGGWEAPHLDVSVFARGLLDRVVTRIYFPDEQAANLADPVLGAITDPDRRATLIAAAEPGLPGQFRFDIRLQGERETVFFDL